MTDTPQYLYAQAMASRKAADVLWQTQWEPLRAREQQFADDCRAAGFNPWRNEDTRRVLTMLADKRTEAYELWRKERKVGDQYMEAYQAALKEAS